MAIDCGKNKLLASLEEKKKALADKLAQLDTLGKDALADIKAAAQEQLDAMNLSIPKLPEIPNFQDEINKLIAKAKAGAPELLEDLQKIQNAWGDLVDNIEDVLDIVKNPLALLDFDICKDVPKVEAKVGADGKLEPTPTTIDVVENIDGNPEQEDPEPVQPTAAEMPADPKVDQIISQSGFSVTQAKAAKAVIVEAEKEFMKSLREKMEETTRGMTQQGDQTQASTMFHNLPSAWKIRNPEGQVADYYLLNPDIRVPPALDRWVLYKSKLTAYANMESAISNYGSKVLLTLGRRPDVRGNNRWYDGKFDEQYKPQLQRQVYNEVGFGIKEYNPEYGYGLRQLCGTDEAKIRIPPAFKFKYNDYRANFIPHFYTITSIRNSTHVEADNDYANMIHDYVNTLFNAKVIISKESRLAFLTMISWTTNTAVKELEDFPSAGNFIPNSVGGKLEPWESVLSGNATEEDTSQVSKHSESSFIPHFMYSTSEDGKRYVTQFADTYQAHKDLASFGFVHEVPKGATQPIRISPELRDFLGEDY